MTGMLEIGALIQISKNFLELFVKVKETLVVSNNASEFQIDVNALMVEMRNRIDKFQQRLEGLAIQLDQSERLTRMIPSWEAYANQIPVWKQFSEFSELEAQQIHVSLRDLINNSIRDQFSSTFFRTSFDKLPGMESKLVIFRANLNNLDRTVSTIPAGNLEAFKALWPQIVAEFNNLRNSGYDVRRHAEDIHGDLINELIQSTQEARVFLADMWRV